MRLGRELWWRRRYRFAVLREPQIREENRVNKVSGRLAGRTAVITGGTSGIGAETARLFVAEGAHVILSGRGKEQGLALAQELGPHARFVAADVMVEEDIAALVAEAMDWTGRLDCMFNNAAGPAPGTLEDVSPEQIDYAMRLLVGSVLLGIKHAVKVMRASGGGSIINNSSIAAQRANQGQYLYSIAKAAVTHLTSLAAIELRRTNVRVNAISPGAISTPLFWGGAAVNVTLSEQEQARRFDKLEHSLARATPTPRSGVPLDIAYAALYLASDEGSYVNGHDLVVDGGRVWDYHEAPREQ
jgi:NAD(P)-dependent dehydrogenase (short-subunit alcohol dehydrogenase family)